MLMIDVQRQRLSHLHTRDSDLRIEHDQADGGADKDEAGFELGYGSREEELHIGSRWRSLADLQIKLEVVHPDDGIRFIDFDGQRISLAIVSEVFFLWADMDSLVTVRPPPA